MQRRSFLQGVLVTVVAPALPGPKPTPTRPEMAKGGPVPYSMETWTSPAPDTLNLVIMADCYHKKLYYFDGHGWRTPDGDESHHPW